MLGLPMGACSMVRGGSMVVVVGPPGRTTEPPAQQFPPPWLMSSAVECSKYKHRSWAPQNPNVRHL